MLAVRQDCISANKHVTLHRSHAHPRGVRFSLYSLDSSFASSWNLISNRRRVEFQHFWSKDQVHLPPPLGCADLYEHVLRREFLPVFFFRFYFKQLRVGHSTAKITVVHLSTQWTLQSEDTWLRPKPVRAKKGLICSITTVHCLCVLTATWLAQLQSVGLLGGRSQAQTSTGLTLRVFK